MIREGLAGDPARWPFVYRSRSAGSSGPRSASLSCRSPSWAICSSTRKTISSNSRSRSAREMQALLAALDGLRKGTGSAGDALDKASALTGLVSDNSNITLDPDMDSYYVGDMLVNQAPAIARGASALLAAARYLDADKEKSGAHKIAFAEARDGLASAAQSFASDLTKAIKGNAGGGV